MYRELLEAVSYTHLDVYKRQGIDATLNEESRCLERVRYPKVDLKDYQ